MTPYKGPERRNVTNSDHDLLIKIDGNMETFIASFKEHVKDDKENFAKMDVRQSNIEKSWFKACGALSVIVIFVEVILKVIFK